MRIQITIDTDGSNEPAAGAICYALHSLVCQMAGLSDHALLWSRFKVKDHKGLTIGHVETIGPDPLG